MAIYGGKTWEHSYFVFDKIYPNYATMCEDLHNIFLGRYVFVEYCEEALLLNEREALHDRTSSTGLIGSKLDYYNNYQIDQNYGYAGGSADRKIYRVTFDETNSIKIPEEVANLNNNLSNEYIDLILRYWSNMQGIATSDEVKFIQGNKNDLPIDIHNGYFYVTIDDGSIYLDTNNRRVQLSTSIEAIQALVDSTSINIYSTTADEFPSPCHCLTMSKNKVLTWDGVVASNFSSGSGTQEDPYIISTPGEFALLWVFPEGADIGGYERKGYYIIPNHIKEFNMQGFIIPNSAYGRFGGTLNGNGIKITNIANILDIGLKVTIQNIHFHFSGDDGNGVLFRCEGNGYDSYVQTHNFNNCVFEKRIASRFLSTHGPQQSTYTNCCFCLDDGITPDGIFSYVRSGQIQLTNILAYNCHVIDEPSGTIEQNSVLSFEDSYMVSKVNAQNIPGLKSVTFSSPQEARIACPFLNWDVDWYDKSVQTLQNYLQALYIDTKKVVISDTAPENKSVIWMKPSTAVATYIIETGVNNGWHYKLWSNHFLELERTVKIESALSSSINIIQGVSYPISFNELHECSVNLMGAYGDANLLWMPIWQTIGDSSKAELQYNGTPNIRLLSVGITNKENIKDTNTILYLNIKASGMVSDTISSLQGVI